MLIADPPGEIETVAKVALPRSGLVQFLISGAPIKTGKE